MEESAGCRSSCHVAGIMSRAVPICSSRSSASTGQALSHRKHPRWPLRLAGARTVPNPQPWASVASQRITMPSMISSISGPRGGQDATGTARGSLWPRGAPAWSSSRRAPRMAFSQSFAVHRANTDAFSSLSGAGITSSAALAVAPGSLGDAAHGSATRFGARLFEPLDFFFFMVSSDFWLLASSSREESCLGDGH